MSLWVLAWLRFCRDPVGLASLAVVVMFFAVVAASAWTPCRGAAC